MSFTPLLGAIDQGTTSSRFIIFDIKGNIVASHQVEFTQIYPRPSWVEHDPQELVESVLLCMNKVGKEMRDKGIHNHYIRAIGLTNQRETTVLWDKDTGLPLYNAIVWADARTTQTVADLQAKEGSEKVQKLCGLPLSTYFAAVKIRWLLDNIKEVQDSYNRGTLCFGTIDSWLLYNFSGGLNGGRHITDASNASRSMLMNINTLKYDPELIKFFGFEKLILPEIVSSSEVYCRIGTGPLSGIPLSGCVGDQPAALIGQKATKPGLAKNTYGTGCFLLYNTGETPVLSKNGLLTTVAYKGKDEKPIYALEGSIAVAGSAIKWARDKLELIKEAAEIGPLAESVKDSAGVVFVTAFTGLFAPYWRDDARGTILGITQYTTRAHIARALVDATFFQTKAILSAMEKDSDKPFEKLRVDGGMTNSDECMQIQSDVLGIEVERPAMRETTALGAAIAAGLAVGVWKGFDDLDDVNSEGTTVFKPRFSERKRERLFSLWQRGVEKSVGWVRKEDAAEFEESEAE